MTRNKTEKSKLVFPKKKNNASGSPGGQAN